MSVLADKRNQGTHNIRSLDTVRIEHNEYKLYTHAKAAQREREISRIHTGKPQRAQKPYMYAKAAQCEQKQSHIRTQNPHNVPKSHTQMYTKSV